MNIFILTFHKYDKAFASDLYLIYNRSPAARVCKSDTDRLLMLYLVHIYMNVVVSHVYDSTRVTLCSGFLSCFQTSVYQTGQAENST